MSEKWGFEIYPSDDLWRHISIRCSTRLCFGFVFPRKGRKIIGDQRWNLKSGRGRILLPWTLRPRQSIGNSSWRHLKVNRNLSLWCVSKVAKSTLILRLFWKLMALKWSKSDDWFPIEIYILLIELVYISLNITDFWTPFCITLGQWLFQKVFAYFRQYFFLPSLIFSMFSMFIL